jgi:hypothetical protein
MKKSLTLLYVLAIPVLADPVAYKVERVVYSSGDTFTDDSPGLQQPLAQIEIGATEHHPKKLPLPSREIFKPMVLVGSAGVANSPTFYEFEKRCEYLCGDEEEECHYTALVGWGHEDIGVPMIAFTGIEGEAREFVSYNETSSSMTIPTLELSHQELAWPQDNYLGLVTRGREATFSFGYGKTASARFDFKAPDCVWTDYRDTGLARLSCNSAEALLHEGRPLLYSTADYNLPTVRVVNRFSLNGAHYYTVVLALKAYTAYGLLTHINDAWKFIVKPADWANLC